MGLFDQLVGAVANTNQLTGMVNMVQQLNQQTGGDPTVMQSLFSVVGNQVRSTLQAKQVAEGEQSVQNTVNQFAGTSPNTAAVNSLFSPQLQQQIAQIAAQHTGLDPALIQQLLPSIVPLVLNFLQAGGNPFLNSFLDADQDGDVDFADAMILINRYI
ncbi:MAG TPA: DUF937 domain-containing protein [Nostocaceae cyanobacterium]|nr:DUF937 domain-containing protein [Nostocaceae cyanobacterium]